jgi:hypothetical protein
VADPAVHPASLHQFPGISVLSSSVFAPGKIIERFSGRMGHVAAGGSVMTAAFDLARILGTSPIYLIGLDLSYPGLKTHLSGSYIQDLVLASSGRLRNPETVYAASVRSSQPIRVLDERGDPVTTDSRLLLYRSWFQGQDMKGVLNATPGGLRVRGVPRVDPKRILSHRETGKTGKVAELGTVCRHRPVQRKNVRRFLEYLSRVRNNLTDVAAVSGEAQDILRRHGRGEGPIEELEAVDRRLLGFREENRLISMVMQRSIHRVLQPALDAEETATNATLYRDIKQAASVLAELVETADRRIRRVIT